MQENRSFDSYFGTYPGADGIPMKNGVPTVCVPDPRTGICVKPYHDTSDTNLGGPHSYNDAVADIDGGKMDGFIKEAEKGAPPACGSGNSCPPADPNGSTDVMGYHTAAEIPNYWAYARDFVLQDHMFSSENSWSLPDHLGLVSLWSALCKNQADPMSCTSSLQPQQPSGGTVYPWTDLTWLLHSKGVSWQYFVGTGGQPDCDNDAATCEATSLNPAQPGIWNPLPNFADVKADGQLGNIVSTAKFYPEARAGTLPAVSWVIPSTAVSEHPADRVDLGQAYVTGLINSVMESPDWGSTAIFLTWDEWGGLYDNVQPPKVDANGYGLRVPGLLISPYAKQGYIDHQVLSFDAYAKFIEDDFLGGERLAPATDGRPDSRPDVRENEPVLGDLQHEFNFNQAPLPPQVLNSGPPWGPAGGTASGPALSTAGTAPFQVDFDGSTSSAPSGSIASWDLSFGDGTPDATGTGAPPSPTASHTYSDPGTYTATLTVTNQAGETSQSSMTIIVHPAPPAVTLNASPPGGVAPVLGVSFTGTATPATGASIASWDLSFGDGTADATGTGSLPAKLASHDYPQAGIYDATLKVTDSHGDTSSQPFTVMVTAPITASPQTAAPDGTVVISGQGYQPGETIQLTFNGQDWSTAPAGSNGTFTSRPLTPPAGTVPGDYTVGASGESSSVYGQMTLPVYTNWAEYRFTPNGQGVNSHETTIGPSNVAQLVPAGWDIATGAPVLATPVIYDGQAYVASSNGTFQQIDISTYTRFKQMTLGNAIDSTPAAASQAVYVGSENGKIYAAHTYCTGGSTDGTCSPFWTYTLGSAIESSPTINNAVLYLGADNGKVYAIGPTSNGRTVLWSYATGGPVKSSPAIAGNLVIVGSSDGKLYGLNITTGKVVFTGTTGGAITSSPAVAGGLAYVGSADGKVYAFSTSCTGTCKPVWSVTTGGPVTSSPAVNGGTVFVGSGDGNLYAISSTTGKIDWTMPTGGAVESSPTVANGVVYVGSDDGKVYAIASSGCGANACPALWSAATGGEVTASPIVSDGHLYVGSHDGNVHVYDLPGTQPSPGKQFRR